MTNRLALLLIVGLLMILLVPLSCGKKKVAEEIPADTARPVVVDTTPKEAEPPPPPPPPPTLQESQFKT
ncbi:MAG TPA: hypothetical protein VN285_03085, partial [Candidatus Deferrimicrobium sp.]|nr:hypothetical protein [Candidatus Deferrimicrobium sp.]